MINTFITLWIRKKVAREKLLCTLTKNRENVKKKMLKNQLDLNLYYIYILTLDYQLQF